MSNELAVALRRQWMRLVGCDEQEIASSIEQDPPVDADSERREVYAAMEIQSNISALREFNEKLGDGDPIKCTRVTRHETPDGPMHTQEDIEI